MNNSEPKYDVGFFAALPPAILLCTGCWGVIYLLFRWFN